MSERTVEATERAHAHARTHERTQLRALHADPLNPREISADALAGLATSEEEFGDISGITWNLTTEQLVTGHQRKQALEAAGATEVVWLDDEWGFIEHPQTGERFKVRRVRWDERKQRAANLVANSPAIAGEFTPAALDQLRSLENEAYFEALRLDALQTMLAAKLAAEERETSEDGEGEEGVTPTKVGSLASRFLIPPFTLLDARQGYWQERKRAWLSIGLRSELGRGEDMLNLDRLVEADRSGKYDHNDQLTPEAQRQLGAYAAFGEAGAVERAGGGLTGTSVFDPVLCEIAYRWFSPPDGLVLDPFAGGSVRGIVAAMCGRKYTGCDLRSEQVEENRRQWEEISSRTPAPGFAEPPDFQPALTPVERVGEIWVKRDDTYAVAGVRGGKVRSCWQLAQGAQGLVTAGSRQSPQVNIVAHIAKRLGIPCRVHVPSGELSPEVSEAQACGAEVIPHTPGYNTVIVARAREDAAERGWMEIPFGMECAEAVKQTSGQVDNIPAEAERLVVPVGSGMSLSGILHGLKRAGRQLPVLGVVVGADPEERLDQWAPKDWRELVQLVRSPVDYHDHAAVTTLGPLQFDPVYEAKALPFLQPGDCFWAVGIRQTAVARPPAAETQPHPTWVCGDSQGVQQLAPGEYDLVFTCPPYADLEVYSEDPRDLSTMSYEAFLAAYRRIIAGAVAMLKPNRFAAIVVGDVRDPKGYYRNFVSHTIQAFEDAGAKLYNEAILVTAVGTLRLRCARIFAAGRKLGKTHQNVLVFCKGDPKLATEACGEVAVADPASLPEAAEEASDGA